MGIAGAVLYSLALISARELAQFPLRADRALGGLRSHWKEWDNEP
jgi:hypothetical protein